mgnify:CR=1 FL=1
MTLSVFNKPINQSVMRFTLKQKLQTRIRESLEARMAIWVHVMCANFLFIWILLMGKPCLPMVSEHFRWVQMLFLNANNVEVHN